MDYWQKSRLFLLLKQVIQHMLLIALNLKILIVNFNKLIVYQESYYQVESRVDIFQKYNARGAMEIFYIGTDPECQARGIGRQITDKSLEVARGLRARKLKQICVADKIVNEYVRPEVAFAVAASIYSQRIMETLNFETLAELRYEDYIRGGKRMSDRIGDVHRTVKFVARKL